MDFEPFASALARVAACRGSTPGPVGGTICVRQDIPTKLENRRWAASFAVVASGRKDLVVAGRTHQLTTGSYTVTPVPLPVASRFVEATPEAPFLALLIEVDPVLLSSIASAMDPVVKRPNEPLHGLFVGTVDESLQDALNRLADAFESGERGRVLGPGYIREIIYRVLSSPNCHGLRQFVEADADGYRISRAIHHIQANIAEALDIEALSRLVGLGRTSFFDRFKLVTGATPLQYQKRFRLLEAQRLLVEERTTAEESAFRVGYTSPSQFNRDYSRMFGEPPHANAVRLRAGR